MEKINYVSNEVKAFMEKITTLCGTEHAHWAKIFTNCFTNTLETTITPQSDGSTYVLTGDIPAMWLRDSVAQVRPYLYLAKTDEKIREMIRGVVARQFAFINIDPYANAFNESDNGAGHQSDNTQMSGHVWERKYEIDSLCYPLQLAYLLYLNTGEVAQFDTVFVCAVDKILHVWETEQNHKNSPYVFTRDTWRKEDTLVNEGFGPYFKECGMTWSGFRPSDDACIYSYLVPSNMFAVVVLGYLEEVFTKICPDEARLLRVQGLKFAIEKGIKEHAIVKNEAGKAIYAYEVDGCNHALVMDDANIPSLLSSAYLGFCEVSDTLYQDTRATVLSRENPYYYEGSVASGIGSSHTPAGYAWHMAIAMEGLTTRDKEEKKRVLDTLCKTDAGTGAMHEGFNVNNPDEFTRDWFSWPNMMFCELVMDYFDMRIQIR